MPVPTWVTGQVLSASDVNNWLTPSVGYKAADLSRASNATPSNDPDLTIPLVANAVYQVQYDLFIGCAAASVNFQYLFAIPSGATGWRNVSYWTGASTQQTALDDLWTQNRVPYLDGAKDWGITASGVIFTSATAANLTLQWAQGTSNATAVILRKGSYLLGQRIG